MGMIKQSKIGTVRADAQRAREEGRRVFVAVFKAGVLSSGMFSGGLGHIAEMIEAVEAEGWRLEHFTYDSTESRTDRVCGLFRPLAEPGR